VQQLCDKLEFNWVFGEVVFWEGVIGWGFGWLAGVLVGGFGWLAGAVVGGVGVLGDGVEDMI